MEPRRIPASEVAGRLLAIIDDGRAADIRNILDRMIADNVIDVETASRACVIAGDRLRERMERGRARKAMSVKP
jgi:hypothetical protein